MRIDSPGVSPSRPRAIIAVSILAILLLTPSALLCADDEHGWAPPDNNPWNVMDYGPFIMHTVAAPVPAGNVAVKGIAIKLGKPGGPRAAILFDTELCRVAAGWTGGFLHLTGVAFDTQHGVNPTVKGTQLFGTRVVDTSTSSRPQSAAVEG